MLDRSIPFWSIILTEGTTGRDGGMAETGSGTGRVSPGPPGDAWGIECIHSVAEYCILPTGLPVLSAAVHRAPFYEIRSHERTEQGRRGLNRNVSSA